MAPLEDGTEKNKIRSCGGEEWCHFSSSSSCCGVVVVERSLPSWTALDPSEHH